MMTLFIFPSDVKVLHDVSRVSVVITHFRRCQFLSVTDQFPGILYFLLVWLLSAVRIPRLWNEVPTTEGMTKIDASHYLPAVVFLLSPVWCTRYLSLAKVVPTNIRGNRIARWLEGMYAWRGSVTAPGRCRAGRSKAIPFCGLRIVRLLGIPVIIHGRENAEVTTLIYIYSFKTEAMSI
jgi:hypothetical protein